MSKIALAAVALLGLAFVFPALAAPSVDLTLEVESAQLAADCTAENTEDWEVAAQISVLNTSEETVTFESTGFSARFNAGGGAQTTNDVSVISSGGFEPGTQVGPGETEVFDPVVRVTLPCDVASAELFGELVIVGRDKRFVDSDAFIEGGTPVPVGPTGIIGIASILGVAGLLAQRLGRKPRAIVSDRPDV